MTMNDTRIIHTDGLEEGIRCAMCTNPMANNRGCDGGCDINESMYRRVLDVIKKNILEQEPCEDATWSIEDVADAFERHGLVKRQEPCEDKEYEKDLNELKDQIFKEGNTLISKQDLLERFVEIDNEYKNSHWNLLQILTNIDILIGKEPCKDAVSRQAVKEQMIYYGFLAPDMTVTEFVEDCLPPVNPQKIGHWIADVDKWGDIVTTVNGYRCNKCNTFNADKDNYCPNCGAKMVEPQESEET